MVNIKEEVVKAVIRKEFESFIIKISHLATNKPYVFSSFKGIEKNIYRAFLSNNIKLHSTSERTLVLEDLDFDVFLKIIYPKNFKERMMFHIISSGNKVYKLSQNLKDNNIKVSEILGYGNLLGKDFYVTPKMKGISFLNVLKDGDNNYLSKFYQIIDEIIKLHKIGYSLADANLKHFFFLDNNLEAFIDIDSIRKVLFFKKNKFAKDIGYLLRPELKLTKEEMDGMLKYYIERVNLKNKHNFKERIEYYRNRRWGGRS